MGLLDKWNKNKFSIYKSEEKTVLKLIESLGKWLEDLIKVTDNKTDLYGDHKGSWQGLNKPTLSEEGMRATVELLNEVTVPNKKDKFYKPLRVLVVSDIHFSKDFFYDVDGFTRMQIMIDKLIEEHNKENIDFCIFLGDLSLDFYWKGKTSVGNYTKELIDRYISQLPFSCYIIRGNHDNYNDDEWIKMTGNPTEFSIKTEENLAFILLDNFRYNYDSEFPFADSPYSAINLPFLKAEMEKLKGNKIILLAHNFNSNMESSETVMYIENNEDILALISGHSHRHDTLTFANKPHFKTGNFSYGIANGTLNPTYTTEYAMGFREIKVTENGLETCYITPAINEGTINQTYNRINQTVISDMFKRKENIFSIVDKLIEKRKEPPYDTQITKGSNLNDFRKPGTYISQSSDITATLINCPIQGNGFKLVVERVNGFGLSDTVRQTIIEGNAVRYAMTRLLSNTIGEWTKILIEKDLDDRISINLTGETFSELFGKMKIGQTLITALTSSSAITPSFISTWGANMRMTKYSSTSAIIELWDKSDNFKEYVGRYYNGNITWYEKTMTQI